jgi:DNA-directed RNA polymerase specialized sigma subunit
VEIQEESTVNAKEYLSQAFKLDQRINSKLEQMALLRDLAVKTTSAMQTDKVQGIKQRSPMENALVKLMSLEEEINADIDQLIDLKRDLSNFIAEIESPSHRLLLELRYLGGSTWEEVAAVMGYDLRWTYRLHRKALKEANERLESSPVECL